MNTVLITLFVAICASTSVAAEYCGPIDATGGTATTSPSATAGETAFSSSTGWHKLAPKPLTAAEEVAHQRFIVSGHACLFQAMVAADDVWFDAILMEKYETTPEERAQIETERDATGDAYRQLPEEDRLLMLTITNKLYDLGSGHKRYNCADGNLS